MMKVIVNTQWALYVNIHKITNHQFRYSNMVYNVDVTCYVPKRNTDKSHKGVAKKKHKKYEQLVGEM